VSGADRAMALATGRAHTLIVAKELDQAARFLISQLEDKELRQSFLLESQEYLPTPGSETELAIEKQWRSIISHKEVQAAISKVARVEPYRLEAP
jgi:hypothetical protein